MTSDFVFKEVLGQEESKPILMVFLNDILGLSIRTPDQIELINPEVNPEYIDDKLCILDIRVQLSDRTGIDVEIQVVNQHNILPRAVFYTCRLCSDQLKRGDDYSQLRPSLGLNLLCFDLYQDDRFYRSFVLKDKETNDAYANDTSYLEICIFEIRKALKQIHKQRQLETKQLSQLSKKDQWVLFLTSGKKEVLEKLALTDQTFYEAFERLATVSSDEKMLAMYRNREKALMDWNSSIKAAREEGEKEGAQLVSDLYALLLRDGRMEDLKKAATDPQLRNTLLHEYGLTME